MVLCLFFSVLFPLYIIGVCQVICYQKRSYLNTVFAITVQISLSIYYSLLRLFTTGISNNTTCLIGKTALVTGGNAGIGFTVAKLLASRGCTVIIADKDNAEKSKQTIIEETGNPNIIVKQLDLASFTSVRKFAKDICATVDSLNILINNAGIGTAPAKKTEDGLDLTMQVNHFGPFLLTHLLVDLLKKSAPSRIVFASSTFAFQHYLIPEKLPLTSEESNDYYSKSVLRYSNSKLCNIITADGFAKKLSGTGVTVNCADPGIAKTDIIKTIPTRYSSMTASMLAWIFSTFLGRSPFIGAQTMFHVATAKELEKVSGKNFNNCKLFIKPQVTSQPEFCRKVWEISEECVKLKSNEKICNTTEKLISFPK